MKRLSLTIFLFGLFCFSAKAQIGAPGLSIGTNEVLFEKGVIDIDLLAEIISEKQNELKQEFAKRTILNYNLSNGPYLTYNYANTVLNAVLDHKDKNVMKKQILESSTETAIVLAIAEAYTKIMKNDIRELELKYLLMMGDSTEMTFLTNKRTNKFKGMRKLLWDKYIAKKKLHDQFVAYYDTLTGDAKKILPHEVISGNRIDRDKNLIFFNTREKRQSVYKDSNFDTKSTDNSQGGLPKVFHIYKMKDLGMYRGYHFYTYLNYLLLDMFLEICRENESLQRLGFFQKNFDQTAFEQRSHYQRLLREYDNDDNPDPDATAFVKKLKEIYQEAGSIIESNLLYANVILNQPKQALREFKAFGKSLIDADAIAIDSTLTSIRTKILGDSLLTATEDQKSALFFVVSKLASKVFAASLKIDMKGIELSESDEKALDDLGLLAHYGKTLIRSEPKITKLDDWVQGINNLMPLLVRLNVKSNGQFEKVIRYLEILEKTIIYYQFTEAHSTIFDEENRSASILEHLAEVFRVLTELNKVESYDQVAKWVVDLGNIFWDLPKNRLMNELSNLQAYLTVDSDNNRIDVKVEDLIVYLGKKYIDDASGDVGLYFTLGFNNAFFSDDNPDTENTLNFASEKIGIKVKLFDIKQKRTYASRKFLVQQKPLINDIYFLAYGSGLLYQIEALKTENDINGMSYGTLIGAHFFNGLDFGLGASSIQLGTDRQWVFTTGFDIPITEYLGRLGKKRAEGK